MEHRGLRQSGSHGAKFRRIERTCAPFGAGNLIHGLNQPRQPGGLTFCGMPCRKLLVHSLPCALPENLRNNSRRHTLVPAIMRKRKSPGCDLLHKGLRRPALNHQNGSENHAIIAGSAFGHPHRLCRDRHGPRWCRPCAGLSHPDLKPFRPDAHSQVLSIGCGRMVHRDREVFEATAATNRVKCRRDTPREFPNTDCVNRA